MGRNAGNLHAVLTHALACGLVRRVVRRVGQPLRGFYHQNHLCQPAQALSVLARNGATHLFVRIEQQHHWALQRSGGLHRSHGFQRHHDAGFHVEHARPPQANTALGVRLLPPRYHRKRAYGPDRIQVCQQQHRLALIRRLRTEPQFHHVAKLCLPMPNTAPAGSLRPLRAHIHGGVYAGERFTRRLNLHQLPQAR